MKKQTLFFTYLAILSIAILFASCFNSGKDKDVKSKNDSLDSVKFVADSIKKAEATIPKILVIQGKNVNLRVEPNLKAIRIKQFQTGDTCEVIEKGNKETIDDNTDFWYKVKRKNKEGWVFGAFTSLKQQAKQDATKPVTTIKKSK